MNGREGLGDLGSFFQFRRLGWLQTKLPYAQTTNPDEERPKPSGELPKTARARKQRKTLSASFSLRDRVLLVSLPDSAT
jgi:hypothetical protein